MEVKVLSEENPGQKRPVCSETDSLHAEISNYDNNIVSVLPVSLLKDAVL